MEIFQLRPTFRSLVMFETHVRYPRRPIASPEISLPICVVRNVGNPIASSSFSVTQDAPRGGELVYIPKSI